MKNKVLKCRFFTLKNRLFDTIHSVNCEVDLGSVTSSGRGDAWSVNLSKQKAFGEAVERLGLKKSLPVYKEIGSPANSNGLAFHYEVEDALNCAYRELVEREVVIRAWATDSPVWVSPLRSSGYVSVKATNLWKEKVEPNNLTVSCLDFGSFNDLSVVGICISSNTPPYSIFGYSASENKKYAFEKAFFEACILFENYGTVSKLTYKESAKEQLNKFLLNIKHYGEKKIKIEEVFPGLISQGESCSSTLTCDPSLFRSKSFDLKRLGIPGYIGRVTHPEFFDFRAGKIANDLGDRRSGELHPVG